MNNQLWNALLTLSTQVATAQVPIYFCALRFQNSIQIAFNQIPKDWPVNELLIIEMGQSFSLNADYTIFYIKNKIRFVLKQKGSLSTATIYAFQHYLPYCFLPMYARREQRTIVIAHFAQTLDGKIATNSADSRWIGNEDNLDHAHRMRALCDAILVGSNTLLSDQPRLTVRRVAGENPIRVIIASQKRDYSSLLNCCDDPIYLLTSKEMQVEGGVEVFKMEARDDGQISCDDILKFLYQKGINSVLIEGGAQTTSNFIKAAKIDILQLHISPILFGSGKSAIVLPPIEAVENAIQFKDFYFQSIGDAMMFVGEMEKGGTSHFPNPKKNNDKSTS